MTPGEKKTAAHHSNTWVNPAYFVEIRDLFPNIKFPFFFSSMSFWTDFSFHTLLKQIKGTPKTQCYSKSTALILMGNTKKNICTNRYLN